MVCNQINYDLNQRELIRNVRVKDNASSHVEMNLSPSGFQADVQQITELLTRSRRRELDAALNKTPYL
jgi:hypothetical protein